VTVIDLLGLTDEHIARRGKRLAGAVVGHAAHDYGYVAGVRRPDVVFMRGNGFATRPVCDFMIELAEHYRGVVFQVAGLARWAPVFVRTERADSVVAMLDADPGFDRVPCPP
jgi:arabinofuranosyltransferase